MANRNELHIHQSGDPKGVTFYVYRSKTPDVSDKSPLVAVVDESTAIKTAYQQIGERLTQDPRDPFTWYTSRVYQNQPAFTIYANGSPIDPKWITSFPNSKMFKLTDRYDMTTNVMTIDYWYLASVFVDDTKPQPGVSYNGPIANALNAPLNFTENFSFTDYTMSISWSLDSTPTTFYYAVKALDKNGFISQVSSERHLALAADPATTSYLVEKAVGIGGPWFQGAIVNALNWLDPNPAVGGHVALSFSAMNNGNRSATLTLTNPWYNWQGNWRPSYFYRVSCRDNEREVSSPIPLTPFYKGINFRPAKYILRRKMDNGMPATLDGVDAVTVKTWMQSDIDITQPTFAFTDSALPGTIYSYTTYVIDDKGMVGQPFYTTVDVR